MISDEELNEKLNEPGDLSRFSGGPDDVRPVGSVVKRTHSDPEGLKKQKEADRLLEEARKAG